MRVGLDNKKYGKNTLTKSCYGTYKIASKDCEVRILYRSFLEHGLR